jgi:TPR repeat protein
MFRTTLAVIVIGFLVSCASTEEMADLRKQVERAESAAAEAVAMYVRAARARSGMAALRLGEIYDKGIPGVSRDYAESLKWYNAARVPGEDVPMAKTR